VKPDERRAGFVRLGVVVGVLATLSVVLAGLFALAGADPDEAVGAGTGLVGVVLVVLALGAFFKASPMSRPRAPDQLVTLTQAEARRDAERLALGLFALGIVFSLVSLAVG
jgi:hypothetical protein